MEWVGVVYDYINHFGYHIKELFKAWGGGLQAERAWGKHCYIQHILNLQTWLNQLPMSQNLMVAEIELSGCDKEVDALCSDHYTQIQLCLRTSGV